MFKKLSGFFSRKSMSIKKQNKIKLSQIDDAYKDVNNLLERNEKLRTNTITKLKEILIYKRDLSRIKVDVIVKRENELRLIKSKEEIMNKDIKDNIILTQKLKSPKSKKEDVIEEVSERIIPLENEMDISTVSFSKSIKLTKDKIINVVPKQINSEDEGMEDGIGEHSKEDDALTSSNIANVPSSSDLANLINESFSTKSDTSQVIKELLGNRKTKGSFTGELDQKTRLSKRKISAMARADFLIQRGLFPTAEPLIESMKALSISEDGRGREDIVKIAVGSAEKKTMSLADKIYGKGD